MSLSKFAFLAIACACLSGSNVFAQEAVPANESGTQVPPVQETPVQIAPVQAALAPRVIAKGTPIVVEVVDLVSSKTAIRDEFFNLRLAEPIKYNDDIIIPAGTPGKGQVVDVGKPGMGGKPGKLVLAARYLEFDGKQIPIRGLAFDLSSKDNSGSAVALAAVGGAVGGVVGLMVTGGNMEVPASTKGRAKLGADFIIDEPAQAPTETQP